MTNNILTFLSTLFDPEDLTCFASVPYDTKLQSIKTPETTQFFAINPMRISRRDANVTKFRNFLIEIDDLPYEQQIEYVTELGVPFTSATFSGGKSIHFIISLQTPLNSEDEYRELVEKIYSIVKHADKSAKNPSRLSRLPTAMRDNGVKQTLLILNDRVNNQELEDWINDNYQESDQKPKKDFSKFTGYLTPGAKNFFVFGAPEGEWNGTLFRVACDCIRAGMTEEQIISRVENINGYIDKQDLSTIKSAVKRATKDLK